MLKNFIKVSFPDSILGPIQKGHPWGFSGKFAPFLKDLQPGSWVAIQNYKSKVYAYGIYTPGELSTLKVFWNKESFELNQFLARIANRLKMRNPLLSKTNSLRLIHGENDYLPGITCDLHNDTLITRIYSPFLLGLSRFIQSFIISYLHEEWKLTIKNSVTQRPNRTSSHWKEIPEFRIWRGSFPEEIGIHQNKVSYKINPRLQKGGIYNDIRNLRNFILQNPNLFPKTNALNLFSNNGFLSKFLEVIGIPKISSLEDSKDCVKVASKNLNESIHSIQRVDLFHSLSSYLENQNEKWGTIIIDPPSLTNSEKDKNKARLLYKKLFSQCLPFLEEEGIMVLCSCSSRIHIQDFERIALETFKENSVYMKLIENLKPELDHPTLPEFPEGNYFKVLIYKKGRKF